MIWAMFLSYLLLEALCIVYSGCQIHLPFIRPRHVQNVVISYRLSVEFGQILAVFTLAGTTVRFVRNVPQATVSCSIMSLKIAGEEK